MVDKEEFAEIENGVAAYSAVMFVAEILAMLVTVTFYIIKRKDDHD